MLPSCPSYPVLSCPVFILLYSLSCPPGGNRFIFTITITNSIELRQQTLDSDLRLTAATKYNYDGLRVACSMEISWWPYRRQTKDEGWGCGCWGCRGRCRGGALGDDWDGSDASLPPFWSSSTFIPVEASCVIESLTLLFHLALSLLTWLFSSHPALPAK